MDNIASIDICPDFSIYLTWGPGKYVTWRMPTILIMKFQVIYTAPVTELCHFWCRNVAWSFDLDLRSFYLGDSMIISCRVVNSTTPSNSRIPCDHPLSSFDGFKLIMCGVLRDRWKWDRKQPRIWNPRPLFAHSPYNIYSVCPTNDGVL